MLLQHVSQAVIGRDRQPIREVVGVLNVETGLNSTIDHDRLAGEHVIDGPPVLFLADVVADKRGRQAPVGVGQPTPVLSHGPAELRLKRHRQGNWEARRPAWQVWATEG